MRKMKKEMQPWIYEAGKDLNIIKPPGEFGIRNIIRKHAPDLEGDVEKLLSALTACLNRLDQLAHKNFPQLGITDSRYPEAWDAIEVLNSLKKEKTDV